MKYLFFAVIIFSASCCHSKKASNSNTTTDPVTESTGKAHPSCIQDMIAKFSSTEKHLRPSKIYSYLYKGNTVYYVQAPCCDNFNELYDAECKLLGNPDGGFTGRGDGKFPDWEAEKKAEKLIWEDKSKQ